MKLSIGTNVFEDCDNLIAHGETPLLSIRPEPGSVQIGLHIPRGTLRIVDNAVEQGEAQVVSCEKMTSVLSSETLIVHAVRTREDVIVVHADLRVLGIAIYTDTSGLHIGDNTFAGNLVRGARTAIQLQ